MNISSYSILNKKHVVLDKPPNICSGFSAVAFIGMLFIFAGYICVYFEPKAKQWFDKAGMSVVTRYIQVPQF